MSCNVPGEGSTPFNTDNSIQPVVGIMFEIEAKSNPLTIQTFEIDTRLGNSDANLGVQIWQSSSPISSAFSNPQLWGEIALTRLVANPEAGLGAIVPAWEFTNIQIAANTKKSIYIRMQSALIDNNVDATKSGGALAYDTPDLKVYTGWYVRPEDTTFPSSQTNDPAPMFAGNIFYDLSLACNAIPKVETSIVYNLALDRKPISEYPLLQNAAYSAFQSLLSSDAILKGMVKNDGLVQVEDGVEVVLESYNGECSSQWASCDALRTTMKFQHNAALTTHEVEERMYKYYLAVSTEQLKVMPPETQAAYVGFLDAQANFQLKLVGVSQTALMDASTIKYLQDQIRDHINRYLLQTISRVTTVYVTDQKLDDFDSIEIKGTVNGLVIAVDTMTDFALRVKNTLKAFNAKFLEQLVFNLNFPGPMAQDKRYEYFLGTSELLDIEVLASDITRAPTPAPTAGENLFNKGSNIVKDNFDSKYLGYIGAAVGAIAVLVILCCVCKHISKNKRLEQEREDRKAERRAKTLLKQREEEEVVVFPTRSFKQVPQRDEEDEERPMPRSKPSQRRQWADNDSYDPSSFASGSDKFLDEASLGDDSGAPVRQVANVYSLGGFRNTMAAPAPKRSTSKKEPKAPHSESEEAKDLLKKEPIKASVIYTREEESAGDLESAAVSGNLFGDNNSFSGGATNNSSAGRRNSTGPGVAAASRSRSQYDDSNNGESSERSYGDDLTESSKKKHKKKKRSKSLGGSSSLADGGRKSSRSHSMSKTASDIEGEDRRHKSSKSSSRRRSSRAASGEDHSDRNYDDEDESEHSTSHRSHKSKKSSRRSSKRGGNVFSDPVFDEEPTKKDPPSMIDLD